MTDFTQAIPVLPEPDWHAVAGIPIVDAGTPLEALGLSREFSVWPAYHKLGIPHAIPECHARGEVFERLLRVAAALPGGVRLVVLDAWRPFAVQQYLYDSLSSALAAHYPRAGEAEPGTAHPPVRLAAEQQPRGAQPASHRRRGGRHPVRRPGPLAGHGQRLRRSRSGLLHRLLRTPGGARRAPATRPRSPSSALSRDARRRFQQPAQRMVALRFRRPFLAWHTGATQALFGPVQLQAMDALWRQQLQKRPPAD